MNIYETDKLLAEYLLFHYGSADEILPRAFAVPEGMRAALDFPARVVSGNWPSLITNFQKNACHAERSEAESKTELVGDRRDKQKAKPLPEGRCEREARASLLLANNPSARFTNRELRALDLGCAVGRSTFELARHCAEVIGIDFSQNFIAAANALQQRGELDFKRLDEGSLTTNCVAKVPHGIDRSRVRFEVGDAMAVRESLGTFDVVLAANLLCRLREPQRCLAQFPQLVRANGHLILATPCTWLSEFTPRENWLGGFVRDGKRIATLDSLTAILSENFDLVATREMPFLIREHARKFQWSISQASVWKRVGG